ncbi:MAG: 1-acyl-sn-glycerol-3-phosphate acyltransferase [Actinomycetota bacterium]|nr:1-acyl-sn-glycerol-3-phosphate acyltransferase [Actinomycetota bacterium]
MRAADEVSGRVDRRARGTRRRDRLAGDALRLGFDRLVMRELRGVWVRGHVPRTGAVWITNHHSWWDVFATVALLRREHPGRPGVLMDPANLATMPFLRHAGALGTGELRTAVARVRGGDVMIIFPEGDLRPAGPLGPVRPGAEWIARWADAPVVVAATRVVLRGRQAPEAYLDLEPTAGSGDGGRDRSWELGPPAALAHRLTVLDEELAHSDPDVPLPGFREVVSGARSWEERIARWSDAWTSTRARVPSVAADSPGRPDR